MNNFKKTKLAVAAAAAIGLSLPASAIVVVGGENGWEVSFDGNINQFYVWTDPDARPSNVIGGNMNVTGEKSSRFRTGLMPALFSFNVKAPTWNGLEMGARISFAGQTNNANTQNSDLGANTGLGAAGIGTVRSNNTDTFGGNLEFREAYFTVDGAFGQILMGRTLDLFMGKNILTDQTLFGVGGTGSVHGGGFTLGRIGYGYLYPNFNAQLRWTSPDMMGFKLSLAAVDPSQVCGEGSINGIAVASGLNCARTTNTPRGEGQISYANTFTNGSYQVWGAGMWQNVKRQPSSISASNNDFNVWGWTVGAQVKIVGFDFNGSYYDGRGLGTSFLLDADSLDATGQKRKNKGWMAQGGYTIMGHTKIAFSYGRSQANETANDSLCRTGGAGCVGGIGLRRLKNQQAYVAGLYHDVNANLKLVAEYSRVINEWYGHGGRQEANVVGVGGYFFW